MPTIEKTDLQMIGAGLGVAAFLALNAMSHTATTRVITSVGTVGMLLLTGRLVERDATRRKLSSEDERAKLVRLHGNATAFWLLMGAVYVGALTEIAADDGGHTFVLISAFGLFARLGASMWHERRV